MKRDIEMSKVYTVGHEKSYDRGIRELGADFQKLGERMAAVNIDECWGVFGSYPGGFAVNSIEDAARLIVEFNKQDEWAIYELDATWDEHTAPSKTGWWRRLLVDSTILRKVEHDNSRNS